jgi:putative glutamine amidotransferase
MTAGPDRHLIGVTTYRQVTSWWAWTTDAALVPGTYLDMIHAVGAQPVLIPPLAAEEGGKGRSDPFGRDPYRRLLTLLDGLVLIGGGDLVADTYGQPTDPRNAGMSGPRDQLELGLLDQALRLDLPVLAICRGMQLLNVYCGGDLVQELTDVVGSTAHRPAPGKFGPVSVTTTPGSEIAALYGDTATVLCSHHQAVGKLGRGLTVTARSEDGVIEAVELDGHRFVVGVQWHPEESGDTRPFEALVAATGQPTSGEGAADTAGTIHREEVGGG